ncbi:hypothetical protein ABT56_22430 [Photobacterium aquae]|uniref:ParB/Sulfiredoxin domain-containing protein n=1 Tax=Photobacterium aquae TaxID=1195763 RepID=A0A0J1GMN2_9GAMM|nr:hypothetical protein [Photobacterium aquae]KLV00871.1 hypothetical protein ABT56_22430 [Photobacterium aquae]
MNTIRKKNTQNLTGAYKNLLNLDNTPLSDEKLNEYAKKFQNDINSSSTGVISNAEKIMQEKPIRLKYNGKEYDFTLSVIPSADILTQTIVLSDINSRFQSDVYLNEYSVSDLINDLGDGQKGQTTPAIGYIDPDTGKIIVVNGSRRRLACHYAKADFLILVCNVKIEVDTAKGISDSSNISKPLSLIEIGHIYINEMENLKISSQNEYARLQRIPKSTVSVAIKAAKISDDIYSLFPSPTDLGRRIITQLDKILSDINPENMSDLILEGKKIRKTTLSFGNNRDLNATRLNTEFFTSFSMFAKTLSVDNLDGVQSRNKPKSQTLNDQQTQVIVTDKDDKLSLSFEKLTPETKNKLISLCQELGINI